MRKAIKIIPLALIALLYMLRVVEVNEGAKVPEIIEVPQDSSIEYHGIEYYISNALLADNARFHEMYPEIDKPGDGTFYLLITMSYNVVKDGSVLKNMLHIKEDELDDVIDLGIFQTINDDLINGKGSKDNTVILPYEMSGSFISSKGSIDDIDIRIIIGTYPVKYEMLITEVAHD